MAADPPVRRRRGRCGLALVLVGTALGLAGCAGYTGDHAQQVAEWASNADLSTNDGYIVADVHEITTGIAERRLTATRTACDGLSTDSATAYGELPTPDTALTDELNTAYLDYTNAAEDCTDASGFTGADFSRYRREIARADAALAAADRRLRALGDH